MESAFTWRDGPVRGADGRLNYFVLAEAESCVGLFNTKTGMMKYLNSGEGLPRFNRWPMEVKNAVVGISKGQQVYRSSFMLLLFLLVNGGRPGLWWQMMRVMDPPRTDAEQRGRTERLNGLLRTIFTEPERWQSFDLSRVAKSVYKGRVFETVKGALVYVGTGRLVVSAVEEEEAPLSPPRSSGRRLRAGPAIVSTPSEPGAMYPGAAPGFYEQAVAAGLITRHGTERGVDRRAHRGTRSSPIVLEDDVPQDEFEQWSESMATPMEDIRHRQARERGRDALDRLREEEEEEELYVPHEAVRGEKRSKAAALEKRAKAASPLMIADQGAGPALPIVSYDPSIAAMSAGRAEAARVRRPFERSAVPGPNSRLRSLRNTSFLPSNASLYDSVLSLRAQEKSEAARRRKRAPAEADEIDRPENARQSRELEELKRKAIKYVQSAQGLKRRRGEEGVKFIGDKMFMLHRNQYAEAMERYKEAYPDDRAVDGMVSPVPTEQYDVESGEEGELYLEMTDEARLSPLRGEVQSESPVQNYRYEASPAALFADSNYDSEGEYIGGTPTQLFGPADDPEYSGTPSSYQYEIENELDPEVLIAMGTEGASEAGQAEEEL